VTGRDADRPPVLAAWGRDATVLERLGGGHRNRVWAVRVGGRRHAARDSGGSRSGPALDWELDLLQELAGAGFTVPLPVPTLDGRRRVGGLVVTTWLEGDPPASERDWRQVADELARLHRLTVGRRQRPGFASTRELLTRSGGGDVDLDLMPAEVVALCRAAWSALACTAAVVHGDPGPQNLRLRGGRVGLLDWDESRVDCPELDLAWLPLDRLGTRREAARTAAEAWEVANGWTVEPDHARRRLAELRRRPRAAPESRSSGCGQPGDPDPVVR
jgi:Ser/Thr protein kinase RdoA (MazF antagonist)